MKTKDELNALKNEMTVLNRKLSELSEYELDFVTGGAEISIKPKGSDFWYSWNPGCVDNGNSRLIPIP